MFYEANFERAAELRLVDQAVVDCVECELKAIRHSEFVEDVVKMVLHGLLADKELLSDFLIPESLGYELHDLFLAIAQQRLLAARAGF